MAMVLALLEILRLGMKRKLSVNMATRSRPTRTNNMLSFKMYVPRSVAREWGVPVSEEGAGSLSLNTTAEAQRFLGNTIERREGNNVVAAVVRGTVEHVPEAYPLLQISDIVIVSRSVEEDTTVLSFRYVDSDGVRTPLTVPSICIRVIPMVVVAKGNTIGGDSIRVHVL